MLGIVIATLIGVAIGWTLCALMVVGSRQDRYEGDEPKPGATLQKNVRALDTEVEG